MFLHEALDLKQTKVISFIGGGGKTTAMFRLASELATQGARVIVTTTTKIFMPTHEQVEVTVVDQDEKLVYRKIEKKFKEHKVLGVGYAVDHQGKLIGIPAEWVAGLAMPADYVLVEADGAGGKPFKAPAGHEPVIPKCTELVIAVVGIDAVGLALNEANVHRPEYIQAITGLAFEEIITTKQIAAVLLHPLGIAKKIPHSKLILLINKVEDESRLNDAWEIGKLVLKGGIRRVVIARLQNEPPVREVML